MAPKATPAAGAPTGAAASASGSILDRLPLAGKIGVGVLFLSLVGVLYFVVLYSDVESAITKEAQRATQLSNELTAAAATKAQYQKDLEEKARREQLSIEQKKVLPDEAESATFLSSIQSVATVSGVALTSWSPMEQVASEFYSKVPMKLTLRGKFHQIAKFFHGVGQLDRIVNLEDIQVKATKGQAPGKAEAGVPSPEGDAPELEVECLATAFRASKGEAVSGKPKRGGH